MYFLPVSLNFGMLKFRYNENDILFLKIIKDIRNWVEESILNTIMIIMTSCRSEYIPRPSFTLMTLTVCLWPLNTLVQSPNSVTHARAVWSELPVYIILFTICKKKEKVIIIKQNKTLKNNIMNVKVFNVIY